MGQSAEQSAVESVDQTGKVRAAKRSLPIDVVVIEENTQAKHPRTDKSTAINTSDGQDSHWLATITTLRGCYPPTRAGNLAKNSMPCLK